MHHVLLKRCVLLVKLDQWLWRTVVSLMAHEQCKALQPVLVCWQVHCVHRLLPLADMMTLFFFWQDFILEHYSEDGNSFEDEIADLVDLRQVEFTHSRSCAYELSVSFLKGFNMRSIHGSLYHAMCHQILCYKVSLLTNSWLWFCCLQKRLKNSKAPFTKAMSSFLRNLHRPCRQQICWICETLFH